MLNLFLFAGRLTAEPETRKTNGGTSVVTFSVATDRDYRKKGEDKTTDFIPCVAYGSNADFIADHFHKGSAIICRSEMHFDKYEKDGQKRTKAEACIEKVWFGESKRNTVEQDIPAWVKDVPEDLPPFPGEEDEPLPF